MKNEKRLKEQLGIENRRGDTFVGFRPTYFRDKTKYHRSDAKQVTRKAIREL